MQSRTLTSIAASAALVILASTLPLVAQAGYSKPENRYYVFDLGSPGGGTIAAAASINEIGWIAGSALQADNTTEHAELWVGTPIDLGTLGGANSAVAWPNKNNKGEIVGISETADMNPFGEDWSCALANFYEITKHVCLGFAWQNGVMSPLPPLPGGFNSYAAAVNNRGQVVGWAENGVHDPTCNHAPPISQFLQFEAVVWGPNPGQITQLSPLASDPDSAATAINSNGQIVGISGLCSNAVGGASAQHAVFWENENVPPVDIGNFDGGVAWNTPTAINNRGQVVGFANLPNTAGGAFNPVAFLWDNVHGMRQLPPLAGDSNNWAWGINARGQVVGQSFGAGAFLYQDGEMMDLNSLVQPDSSLNLLLANDVNERGEIVGYALNTNTGAIVAFLAVPLYGGTADASVRANHPRNLLPQSIRRRLPGFARFALGATGTR